TVRLKETGEAVRARREYRAPSEEEVEAMRDTMARAATPVEVSPADEALAELKRLRPGAVLHSRGAIVGDDLVVTTELTAPQVEGGRWKEGGDVQVMVSGGDGFVTSGRGRIESGARSAVVRIPLKGAAGPFNASIRLRSATDGGSEDGLTIARSASVLGAPLV